LLIDRPTAAHVGGLTGPTRSVFAFCESGLGGQRHSRVEQIPVTLVITLSQKQGIS
jgi:hypothetical protein